MWEHRAEVQASVECTVCGNDVELEADTDCWVEGWKGRWEHDGFGPAMGECCGLLYADWWEGTFGSPSRRARKGAAVSADSPAPTRSRLPWARR